MPFPFVVNAALLGMVVPCVVGLVGLVAGTDGQEERDGEGVGRLEGEWERERVGIRRQEGVD